MTPSPPRREVEDDDGLLLIYTSGTTGRPKGAVLTHANCFWTNLSFDLATGLTGDDVVLQVLPQFHCGGWNVQSLLTWWKGGKVVLERSFDAARVLGLLAEKRVTTMMACRRSTSSSRRSRASPRRTCRTSASRSSAARRCPTSCSATWQARGIEIVQGYGLTEAAPNVLCLPPEDAMRKLGSAGKPYAFVEMRLGDEGELEVRGPNVFPGYWRNPEATAEVLARRLALHRRRGRGATTRATTGSSAGSRTCTSPGARTSIPAEVESVLHEHPASRTRRSSACPTSAGARSGSRSWSLAEPVDDEALIAHCRERLARYKVPKRVRFVDALPMVGDEQGAEGRAAGARHAEVPA